MSRKKVRLSDLMDIISGPVIDVEVRRGMDTETEFTVDIDADILCKIGDYEVIQIAADSGRVCVCVTPT